MFDDLKHAFMEAVANFKHELRRDEIPGTVDRILAGMREEATEASARLKALEEDLEATRARAAREGEEEATCRRREELARKIGDEDTARVAGEWADKHARRREVLEAKAEAMARELELGRADVEQMIATLKEARDNRSSLAASAGRAEARESIREADGLFAELDRMAEKLGDDARRQDAPESLDLDDLDGGPGPAGPPPPPDVDARLEELKRRMGKG